MNAKDCLKKLVPAGLWRKLRERKIVAQHARVARLCEDLIAENAGKDLPKAKATRELCSEKIIWQYWAQGYDNLPPVVEECLASVDKYCGDYQVIRLTDETVSDYLEFPEWFEAKRQKMSKAHFSDVLRVALLSCYGGVWMDATILLTGPIPQEYLDMPFFVFQRDPDEKNKEYWRDTYAYYFSWADGFRVNMLNSFIISGKGNKLTGDLLQYLLKWWQEHDALPDYFFFQILFDVLVKGPLAQENCEIVSDCLPHYLQQFRNDLAFTLMGLEEITKVATIHKLTNKA